MSLSPLTRPDPVPRFYLYGEPHRVVDRRFVHVESLDDRSRPSEWTIRPHAHAELNHLFHLELGGGAMRAEDRILAFSAPCLLIVPAGVVHGFSWITESKGEVVTASTAYLRRLQDCDPSLSPLFQGASVHSLEARESVLIAEAADALRTELSWMAPGHGAAVESGLLRLLVGVVRARGGHGTSVLSTPLGRDAALVARLRERIEARFRLREPLGAYLAALGCSATRLRRATAALAGQSPMQMLDQRALLEAQRLLLYSSLTVSDIAQGLGFEDVAYFSRFFTRRAGAPPRLFRLRTQNGEHG